MTVDIGCRFIEPYQCYKEYRNIQDGATKEDESRASETKNKRTKEQKRTSQKINRKRIYHGRLCLHGAEERPDMVPFDHPVPCQIG